MSENETTINRKEETFKFIDSELDKLKKADANTPTESLLIRLVYEMLETEKSRISYLSMLQKNAGLVVKMIDSLTERISLIDKKNDNNEILLQIKNDLDKLKEHQPSLEWVDKFFKHETTSKE